MELKELVTRARKLDHVFNEKFSYYFEKKKKLPKDDNWLFTQLERILGDELRDAIKEKAKINTEQPGR